MGRILKEMEVPIAIGILILVSGISAKEQNCSTSCWFKNGECLWEPPPPDDGYVGIGVCQEGQWGVGDEVCYCGRCYACEQNLDCPGKCSLRSPGQNFMESSTPCNKDKRCKCWVENPPSRCNPHHLREKFCLWVYNGECSIDPPNVESLPTGFYCNETTKCQCWREPCIDEFQLCSIEGGVCNTTQPSPQYMRTDIRCNRDKACHCWIKKPEPCDPQSDEKCREEYGGSCWVEPPIPLNPTGYYCNKELDCQCWTRNCTSDEFCYKGFPGGTCSVKQPGMDYKPTDYFCRNGPPKCRCWEKKENPCAEKKCPDGIEGTCAVKSSPGWVNTKAKCIGNGSKKCTCHVKECEPNSISKNCDGGRCWPASQSPGNGWRSNGLCNKWSKCKCWKCKQQLKCSKKGGRCKPNGKLDINEQQIGKCKDDCICVKKNLPTVNATETLPNE